MILIIQNGNFQTSLSRYLDEEFEIIKSQAIDINKINLDSYSVIIILGGHQSVRQIDKYSELKNVVEVIKKCIELKKPVFGICLGCQLIAHVLGCEIKTSSKLNIGYDTKILGYEYIFRCHYDYVEPNDKIEILDNFDSMLYAFRHQNLFGIQCHPDIPADTVTKYETNESIKKFAKENQHLIEHNNKALIEYIINSLKNLT